MSNEVYDLTTEDDDGGMTLNVEGDAPTPIVISDDDGEVVEEGEQDDDDGDDIEEPEDQQQLREHSEILDDDLEEGEERDIVQPAHPGHMDVDRVRDAADASTEEITFVIDPNPSAPSHVCLKDLDPDQLEDQIRYAFWHLERHQIDLSRPARCLHCQAEGHVDQECPQKTCAHCAAYADHESALCPKVRRCDRCRQQGHIRRECTGMRNTTKPCDLCALPGHQEEKCPLKHYMRVKVPSSEKLKLWISCCSCGSKSHLVGDCPELPREKAARWSLRALDPAQVVNLSLQTGIDKLEKEAENRNMRPAGMKIKGRASMHHADASRRDQSYSDDDDFFSHPPVSRGAGSDAYRPRRDQRQERFDRFNPPGRTDAYRPPRNAFYGTDSFGRPRSRSPGPPRYNDYSRRRSPSFDDSSIDSWRPDQGSTHVNTRRGHSPPRAQSHHRGRPAPTLPRPGVSIQLPTRKGSNTSMRDAGAANQTNPQRPPQRAEKQSVANGEEGSSSNRRRKSLATKQRRQTRRAQGRDK